MGVLHYNDHAFEFEDRVLAHIQIVAAVKLRRSECFFLSWLPSHQRGAGRQALWIGIGIPLHFSYQATAMPVINRSWIESLITAANGGSGLNLSDDRNKEPAAIS